MIHSSVGTWFDGFGFRQFKGFCIVTFRCSLKYIFGVGCAYAS